MRQHRHFLLVVLALACTGHPVHAQSTALSYQGNLRDGDGLLKGPKK